MDSKLTLTSPKAERQLSEEIEGEEEESTGLLPHHHAAVQALSHEADNLVDYPTEQLHVQTCVNEVLSSLRSEQCVDLSVVCVMGQNGIGKSFHLNAVLRSTEILESEYYRRQHPTKLEGEIWAKSKTQGPSDCSLTEEDGASDAAGDGLAAGAEAAGGGDSEECDPDLVVCEPQAGVFQANGRLEDAAARRVEFQEHREIVSHCDPDVPFPKTVGARPPLAGRYSFLLPSRSGAGTTTHTAISLQYTSGMYHFALRYCGERELIDKLRSFPWQDYTRRAPLPKGHKEHLTDSQRFYHRYMRLLLHRVRVPPSAPTTAAAAQAPPVQSRRPRGRKGSFARRRARVSSESASCQHELRDLAPGEEICIKPELKPFLGKTFVFKSHGTRLVHDRLYIREILQRELYDVPQHVLITEVAVFAPCDVLRGVELVDTPGTADADELHKAQLQKTLERADHVLLFLKRILTASAEDRTIVSDQLLPRLAWKQTGERPVSLTVVSSTEKEMRAEVTVEALAFSQQRKDLNAQLEKHAEGTAAAARIEAELEEMELRSSVAAIDIHEKVMDSTYQDVWTMVAEQYPQLDADEIMDEVQMMDTYPFMYMSLVFNSNFRNAYDSSAADAATADMRGKWLEQYQLALERSNGGKLLDILTRISTDNTAVYDAALRPVEKLVQFVQGQQERQLKQQADAPQVTKKEEIVPTAAVTQTFVWQSGATEEAVQDAAQALLKRWSTVLTAQIKRMKHQPYTTLNRLTDVLAGAQKVTTRRGRREAAAAAAAAAVTADGGSIAGAGESKTAGSVIGNGDGSREPSTAALEGALERWQQKSYSAVAQSFAFALAQTLVKYSHRLTESGLDPNLKGRGPSALPFAPVRTAVRKALAPFKDTLSELATRVADTVVQQAQAQVKLSLERLTAAAVEVGSPADGERMSRMIAAFVDGRCPVMFSKARRKIEGLAVKEWYRVVRAEVENQFVRMLRDTRAIQKRRRDGSWSASVEQAMLKTSAKLPNRLALVARAVFEGRRTTALNMLMNRKSVGGMGNAVKEFMRLLQAEVQQCKRERGENAAAAAATAMPAAVGPTAANPAAQQQQAEQRRQALESVLCSAQTLRCSLQEQKQQEEAERQQQEPRSIERRLMARRLMQSCARGIPNERAVQRTLKQIMSSVRRRRSASSYRGSAGDAAALHRHMVAAASAASTATGMVQLPRQFWKLQEPTLVRPLRLYSAVLTQELQSLTAEAAETPAALGAICRVLRDRVIHYTMLHTSSHHRRAQFYATFPVTAAHTSAAAAAAGAGSTPAEGGGPTVAAQLVDHLIGRTDGGAWAVQQLANQFNVPVDVYVAGRNGTPFHIHPQAPHAPAVAAAPAAGSGGRSQQVTLAPTPTVGAPLRVAWSAQLGFIAIAVTSRLPSQGGEVPTHVRTIPSRGALPAFPPRAGGGGGGAARRRRRRSRSLSRSRSPSNGRSSNRSGYPSSAQKRRRLG